MLASAGLLMLAGTAAADGSPVALNPAIDFGRAVVGSGTYTKFVELYNGTSSSLQVVSPKPGMFGDFSVGASGECPRPPSGSALAPGATCTMAVQYTPTALGPQAVNAGIAFCDVNAIDIVTNPDGTKDGVCPAPAVLGVPFAVTGSGVAADALTAGSATLSFGSTPQQAVGSPQTVTLTNGSEPISITGLSTSGPAAHDFQIGEDGCTGATLLPHAICTFNVRFAPSQTGERDATLGVNGATFGNAYPSLSLSGTGGALGQNGNTGPTGNPAASGPQGLPGPAGKVDLLTCKASPKPKRGRQVAAKQCTLQLLSNPSQFTTTGTNSLATLSRGSHIYATGSSWSTGGRQRLLLHEVRRLRPGLYTLTVRRRPGARRVITRLRIIG
jgi:hypothetical protein